MAAKKNLNDHLLSDDAKEKYKVFSEKNQELQKAMSAFFDNNSAELATIDRLREDRNEALDDMKKALRAEAEMMDITKVQKLALGEFFVQKKWSSWYIVEHFVELAQASGMYDSAVAEGVVREVTQVDGNLAEEWLRKNSLTDKFQAALDGKELTPAITGPKEVLPLGSERK